MHLNLLRLQVVRELMMIMSAVVHGCCLFTGRFSLFIYGTGGGVILRDFRGETGSFFTTGVGQDGIIFLGAEWQKRMSTQHTITPIYWKCAHMCRQVCSTKLPMGLLSSAHKTFPPFWILWKTCFCQLLLHCRSDSHQHFYGSSLHQAGQSNGNQYP